MKVAMGVVVDVELPISMILYSNFIAGLRRSGQGLGQGHCQVRFGLEIDSWRLVKVAGRWRLVGLAAVAVRVAGEWRQGPLAI